MKNIVKEFKRIFIPYVHNDYKPHFFRELSVAVIAIIIVVLFSISLGTRLYIKNTDMTATVLPSVLIDLTNQTRASNNVLALNRSDTLDLAAQLKAKDMSANGYFAHTSPSGITPWHWFSQAGYSFTYAGENLAIDFTESADVENAWINSPTHKANLLSSHFNEIGIATVDGVYNGRPTTYVVQMFGARAFIPKEINTEIPKTKTKVATVIPVTKKVDTSKVALVPLVKGESVEIVNNKLETIIDTKDFVSVKNTSVEETAQSGEAPQIHRYSTWYERLIFMIPGYTDHVYHVLMWIVLVALFVMTFFEIKRQHPKNIIYGILLLIIIFCFIFINKNILIIDLCL